MTSGVPPRPLKRIDLRAMASPLCSGTGAPIAASQEGMEGGMGDRSLVLLRCWVRDLEAQIPAPHPRLCILRLVPAPL